MALGKLGILELLAQLYGQVRLTTAVYAEVVVKGREWGYIDACGGARQENWSLLR